jgi:glyoxylase I family protein
LTIQASATRLALRPKSSAASSSISATVPALPCSDLVQFNDPLPQGQPYSTLNNIGICRIAFSVDDIDRTYADLQAKEVQFVAALKKIKRPDGATSGVVCFKDPDGAILELISGL